MKKIRFLVDAVIIDYNNAMLNYTFFDHTADIGVEIFGQTRKELFANASLALKEILFDIPSTEPLRGRKKIITVEGADTTDLLINYLREILYLVNGEGWIVRNAEITRCGSKRLTANLQLEPFDQKKYAIKVELKAVTYHNASVKKEQSGWRAKVIFDV